MWNAILIWLMTKEADKLLKKWQNRRHSTRQFIREWKAWYHVLQRVQEGELRLVAVPVDSEVVAYLNGRES